MLEMNLQLDDEVAETLRREGRRLQITGEERAAQVLLGHHENCQRFPDGVLREGRRKLIEFLTPVPCLRNFDSSGVDFRFWWVSFEIDTSSPIAWAVIRALGLYLNTFSVEMRLPTAFKPIPNEWPNKPFRWQIESTAPLLDPCEVVEWLADNLPTPLSANEAWLSQH
jgi:hypothetical protein